MQQQKQKAEKAVKHLLEAQNQRSRNKVKGRLDAPFLFNIESMEKKVLLFSGGFDSTLQEFLIKPDVLLYVDMHTTYSEREKEHLRTLSEHYQKKLIIKDLPLGEFERENMYLPYRNLMLGTIAMEYGQHVYFGFNLTDNAPDKDEVFLRRINSLFRHLNVNCVWDMNWENKKFGFYAPFKSMTKTQMVSRCLSEGMEPSAIQHIRSCYSGTSVKGCGVCPVCRNKAIALLNNGIYDKDLFDKPITDSQLKKVLKDAKENPTEYPITFIKEVERARELLRQTQE